MNRFTLAPAVLDLINDPIALLLMDADGVREEELLSILRDATRRLQRSEQAHRALQAGALVWAGEGAEGGCSCTE